MEDSQWSEKARFWPCDLIHLCASVSMSSKLGYIFVLYVITVSDNLWIFWFGILKWYIIICATWVLLGRQVVYDETNHHNGGGTTYLSHRHITWDKNFMTFSILLGTYTFIQAHNFMMFFCIDYDKKWRHKLVTIE